MEAPFAADPARARRLALRFGDLPLASSTTGTTEATLRLRPYLARALAPPATTLVLLASKCFTTAETQANAELVRAWLRQGLGDDSQLAHHVAAATARPELAGKLGAPADAIFPLWDWVGGRYSLWSAVGL